MRKFFSHYESANKLVHVSAILIVIENRNNGLRNRKLDFTRTPASVNLILSLARTVITDFEKAAMNAVSNIFANAHRRGCRFHLGQSWWHRIQTLGMSVDYKTRSI